MLQDLAIAIILARAHLGNRQRHRDKRTGLPARLWEEFRLADLAQWRTKALRHFGCVAANVLFQPTYGFI
ncbi:hypothetical protein CK222_14930 [Mesorhizobium sp. WSM3866]|nr:hypothetical protein A9K66_14480 [Mesorhizobium sp. AA23]PBB30992.1 hypothetical protein CK214_18325 [Mesorhizobium sp. WSM3882]PBB32615.1 hypothetical protein CK221_24820 [Mesorhizobium sp. WSM3868]PBB43153.1 hypothetical protein CK222_14930 [Mesorhizobium sp. WSM3866]PBB94310.1 hypothetical protein CK215_02410 [Mesorhizobium sp. WSM3864]PBB99956.1 hypothetical protein CK224_01910 [Mesorhizobium sp. WSM3862]